MTRTRASWGDTTVSDRLRKRAGTLTQQVQQRNTVYTHQLMLKAFCSKTGSFLYATEQRETKQPTKAGGTQHITIPALSVAALRPSVEHNIQTARSIHNTSTLLCHTLSPVTQARHTCTGNTRGTVQHSCNSSAFTRDGRRLVDTTLTSRAQTRTKALTHVRLSVASSRRRASASDGRAAGSMATMSRTRAQKSSTGYPAAAPRLACSCPLRRVLSRPRREGTRRSGVV